MHLIILTDSLKIHNLAFDFKTTNNFIGISIVLDLETLSSVILRKVLPVNNSHLDQPPLWQQPRDI
jgi:hypothetical protein